jgi:hypothetical protein
MKIEELCATDALSEYDKMIDLPKSEWVRYGSVIAGKLAERLDSLSSFAESGIELDENGDLKLPCNSKLMPLRDFVSICTWLDRKYKSAKVGFVPLD